MPAETPPAKPTKPPAGPAAIDDAPPPSAPSDAKPATRSAGERRSKPFVGSAPEPEPKRETPPAPQPATAPATEAPPAEPTADPSSDEEPTAGEYTAFAEAMTEATETLKRIGAIADLTPRSAFPLFRVCFGPPSGFQRATYIRAASAKAAVASVRSCRDFDGTEPVFFNAAEVGGGHEEMQVPVA